MRRPQINKKKVLWIFLLFLLLYSAVFFYFEAGELTRILANIRLEYLFLTLFISVTSTVFDYLSWRHFTNLTNIKIPFFDNLLIYFSGFSGSILPAKIGELIRVYLMKKRGISIKKTFACHVSTVLTILISSLLILLVMLFLSLQPILVKALIILTILILIILFVLKSKFVFNIVSSVLKKISWTKKFLNESSNAHSTLRYMLKVKNFIVTVPFSSIAWLMDSMIVYFILIGLGASITIIQAIIVLVLVSVAGSFSMLPGGFLIAEGGFFSLLILYNTPIPIAAMATILIRLVTFWFKIFYGFIALHIYNQRIKRLELHP